MSIKVQCPNPGCGRVFSVKAEYAGRKAKCPGCASPLIIPTPPDAGAFDFGALTADPSAAPPDAGNPFAELAAAPAPPPPKPKSVRKPAPPVEPPRPVAPPPPIAEAVVEPVPEAVPFVTASPPVATPSVRAADGGDFANIVEPELASPAKQPEPWFYGFLQGYAKILMFLGLLGAAVFGVFGLWSLYGMWANNFPIIMLVIYLLGTLIGIAITVITVLVSVAFILLGVDIGRTLRAVLRVLSRRE